MVEIFMQGGSIELDESEKYNKVRHRMNRASKLVIDYESGKLEEETEEGKKLKFEPFHLLSFKTADGGRVSINPEKVIAITSDEERDEHGGDDEEEDDE